MKTKMLPHSKRPRSHPPTIGTEAIPIPVVAPHSPMALARSARVGEDVRDQRESRREDSGGAECP